MTTISVPNSGFWSKVINVRIPLRHFYSRLTILNPLINHWKLWIEYKYFWNDNTINVYLGELQIICTEKKHKIMKIIFK